MRHCAAGADLRAFWVVDPGLGDKDSPGHLAIDAITVAVDITRVRQVRSLCEVGATVFAAVRCIPIDVVPTGLAAIDDTERIRTARRTVLGTAHLAARTTIKHGNQRCFTAKLLRVAVAKTRVAGDHRAQALAADCSGIFRGTQLAARAAVLEVRLHIEVFVDLTVAIIVPEVTTLRRLLIGVASIFTTVLGIGVDVVEPRMTVAHPTAFFVAQSLCRGKRTSMPTRQAVVEGETLGFTACNFHGTVEPALFAFLQFTGSINAHWNGVLTLAGHPTGSAIVQIGHQTKAFVNSAIAIVVLPVTELNPGNVRIAGVLATVLEVIVHIEETRVAGGKHTAASQTLTHPLIETTGPAFIGARGIIAATPCDKAEQGED